MDPMVAQRVDRALRVDDGASVRGLGVVQRIDDLNTLFEEIEGYLYTPTRKVVSCGVAFLRAYSSVTGVDYWKAIVSRHKIRPDERLYRKLLQRAKDVPVDPTAKYLDTWLIDPNKSYHAMLIGRVPETNTFGLLKQFEWFAFFAFLSGGKSMEVRTIASLVAHANGAPFIQKKGDNSQVTDIKLFYNIQNITESLLNVANLRYSLAERYLNLSLSEPSGYKDIRIDLHAVLDEMCYTYCVSPKVVCGDIRGLLTYTVRMSGACAYRQATYKHNSMSVGAKIRGNTMTKIEFDGEDFFNPYINNKYSTSVYTEGMEALRKYGMKNLIQLVRAIMYTSLVRTPPRDFVLASSFLLSLMSIAGYGRALPFQSSPRSAPERDDDPLRVGEAVHDLILNLDKQAKQKGFLPPTGHRWLQNSIATWRSTSAGMSSTEVELIIDGRKTKARVRKKAAVGALLGKSAFSRKLLSRKLTRNEPGSVGYRDVPYKATRAIYVISLVTQNAQIGVSQHLVDYVSTKGVNSSLIKKEIDPSHFATGPSSTTGIRLNDNYDTIQASGDLSMLALGTDLSEFDSHNVYWNFRKPMLDALHSLGLGESYGPERITHAEMVEYAFGRGYVHDTYWDNGREPIVILARDVKLTDVPLKYHRYLTRIEVGRRVPKLKPMAGCSAAEEGSHYMYAVAESIKDSVAIPWDMLRVCIRLDGSDLVHLTSEASGEKTTLFMNTVVNIAMQRIVLKNLKNTEFGKYYTPIYQKAVGDDSEWIGPVNPIKDVRIVEEGIEFLHDQYAAMGHILSKQKTFVVPGSGEFVQSFARFGLYIPRDCIMTIASEKPRDVRNPLAYAASLRSVILAKMARGMNARYASVFFLFQYRAVHRLVLKRHDVVWGAEANLRVPRERNVNVQATRVKISRMSGDVYKLSRKFTTYFVPHILHACLPQTSGGVGFFIPLPCVILTPALFLRYLSEIDKESGIILLAMDAYFKSRRKNNGERIGNGAEKERIKIPEKLHTITVAEIFSPTVNEFITRAKDIKIGRLSAENAPKDLLKRGLLMENFMISEAASIREEYSEYFIASLTHPLHSVPMVDDEWVLSFSPIVQKVDGQGSKCIYYTGLCEEYERIREALGLSWHGNSLVNTIEKFRAVISRDPFLRGLRSPEEIIGLLDRFGIDTTLDREIGMILLRRMGFESEIAASILDVRFNPDTMNGGDTTFGAFSDDYTCMLDLCTRERLNAMSFPRGIDSRGRRILFTYAASASLMMYALRGVMNIAVRFEEREDGSDIVKNLVTLPRVSRRMASGVRTESGLTTALLRDLCDTVRSIKLDNIDRESAL